MGDPNPQSAKAKPLQPGRVTFLGDTLEPLKVAVTKLFGYQFGFLSPPQTTKPVPLAKQKNPLPNAQANTAQKPCRDRHEDYATFIKCGGSPAWRNNNPGNMIFTSDSVSTFGALGRSTSAPVRAKFADEETGTAALIKLLETKYKDMKVAEALIIYAPEKDHNDPVAYAKFLVARGIDPDKKVGEQAEKMVPLIKVKEGWIPGTIIPKLPPEKK